jgi:translation elongation factor EF-Ts
MITLVIEIQKKTDFIAQSDFQNLAEKKAICSVDM